MEEEILKSLKLRPGIENVTEEFLMDLVKDCIFELKDLLNYRDSDILPESLYGVVKEIILYNYNQDGVQGLQTETQSSGGSASFLTDIPAKLKRRIYRYRKLR